jgi:hypothetical protein
MPAVDRGVVTGGEINMIKLVNGAYQHPDDPGEPIFMTPRISITDDEGEILYILSKGKDVLEIGTGLGVSTCWLADNAHKVVSVDIDPWVQEKVWPGIENKYKNVIFLRRLEKSRFLVDMAAMRSTWSRKISNW